MKRIFKYFLCLCLIFCFSITLTACNSEKENITKKATIDGVQYTSLTEAVDNAKTGDTIKVYNDLKDNKNVVISKPLTIEGVSSDSQTKPKFYGSLTIDLSGQKDLANIENIEIIHKGEEADGENNNTTIGINLVDGGLTLKSSSISLDTSADPSKLASGLIISRKAGSENIMPIIVKGNSFGSYKTDNQNLSSALIIKSNLDNVFQNLNLNELEIYDENAFSSSEDGNQFISINYSLTPPTFSYFVTSSSEELIKALENNQSQNGSSFKLLPFSPLKNIPENPITIDNKTALEISGNTPADLAGTTLVVKGSLLVNGELENAIIEKGNSTASIIFGENSSTSQVEIK